MSFFDTSAILRYLFPPIVMPGDVAVFDDGSNNPFKDAPHRVIVKATDGDWINYRFETGQTFQNESMKRRTFAFCYRKFGTKN